jgi:UPF0755 protein
VKLATGGQKGGVLLRTLIVLLVLGLVAIGGVAFEINRRLNVEGPLASTDILWVERGDTVVQVGQKLQAMNALQDGAAGDYLWKIATRIEALAPALRAGEYEVPAGASINDVVALLKEGKPLLRFVTVPEGRTSAQVMAIVNEAVLMDGVIETPPPEGTLLPETYSYQRGDTRASVIERMQAAQREVLDELWETRAEDLPFDTKEEAVILASIVEKETGLADERPRVAAVFVNRMKRRMRLQSDPTVIYGLTGGEPLGRGIRRSELRRETPYNTYVIAGLPPTPIANPGRDAIAAVLNPPVTDDLYFVADGTGGHAFSTTLAEHSRNVAKWREIERARRSGN